MCVLGNLALSFYAWTLWVIFEEILDSVYKETRGDKVPGSLCPTPFYIEFYGDIATGGKHDTKHCLQCSPHQMNESQRSNQAIQWKPDQSVLPFFLGRKLLPSN